MAKDDTRLSDFEKEFTVYQGQKKRGVGGAEPRILQNLAMYVGEQWVWHENGKLQNRNPKRDDQGRISEVNLVLNMIAPRAQKIMGRLLASDPVFKAFPNTIDAKKIAQAEVVSQLIPAFNQKLDESDLKWQRWFWMMMGGFFIEHTPWRVDHIIDTVHRTDDATGNPIWMHLATREEMSHEEYIRLITPPDIPPPIDPTTGQPGEPFPAQALPEHFEVATEVKPVGDMAAEVRGPLNTFCPNSIRSLRELAPGQSLMFADIRLLDWIKKTWPNADHNMIKRQSDFKIVTTQISEKVSFSNSSLRDLIPVVQGSIGENDPDMAVILERYEPPSLEFPPGWSQKKGANTGPGFIEAPDETFANGGRYSVFSPGQGILRDGEIPYEDGIPAVDAHWDVAATNFYSPDWCTSLNGPQKSINTIASQMRTLGNSRIYDPILIDEELDVPETDQPRWLKGGMRDGVRMAERLGASDIPASYPKQLDSMIQIFNDLAGGDDLFSEPSFPGQIRGTGAVQMLQEVMDSQWGPKLKHYHSRLGDIHHMRTMRAKQFYPAIRTLRYADAHGKVETFEFHADDILRAGVDFNISVEPSSIMPETRQQRFVRVGEMLDGPLAGLLYNERTQQTDWNKVAQMVEWGDVSERESKITKDIKFAKSVIAALKEGRPAPPALPFQNHLVFIDELEMEMNDDDFFQLLSTETQTILVDRYNEHQEILASLQAQEQQAIIDEGTMDIIRQTVQSSVAKATALQFDTLQEQGLVREEAVDPLAQAEQLGVVPPQQQQ